MNDKIGKKIKDRRLERRLTQKALSKDICTQSQISHIEKGELSPSSSVLFKISQRLLVDMNYFFDVAPMQSTEYINAHFCEVKKMIEQLNHKNYSTIKYIVNSELENYKGSKFSYERRYLLWHKKVSEYHLKYNFEEAVHFLEDLIVIDVEGEEEVLLNINIQVSIAKMYQDEMKYEDASQIYKAQLNELSKLKKMNSFQLELDILFELSQSLTYIEQYNDSKKYCLRGISACLEEQTLHYLADFYYQLGINLFEMRKEAEGMKNIDTALVLYKVQKNRHMVYILEKLKSNYQPIIN